MYLGAVPFVIIVDATAHTTLMSPKALDLERRVGRVARRPSRLAARERAVARAARSRVAGSGVSRSRPAQREKCTAPGSLRLRLSLRGVLERTCVLRPGGYTSILVS